MSDRRPRIALLTPIPAPYRLPFFAALSEHAELTVFFDALSEPNRRWIWRDSDFRFRYRLLKGLFIPVPRRRAGEASPSRRYLQLRWSIIPELFRLKPDIVVSAEMGPRSLQAALYCRLTGARLILWWEGTPHTEGRIAGLKARVRRFLVRRAARFW